MVNGKPYMAYINGSVMGKWGIVFIRGKRCFNWIKTAKNMLYRAWTGFDMLSDAWQACSNPLLINDSGGQQSVLLLQHLPNSPLKRTPCAPQLCWFRISIKKSTKTKDKNTLDVGVFQTNWTLTNSGAAPAGGQRWRLQVSLPRAGCWWTVGNHGNRFFADWEGKMLDVWWMVMGKSWFFLYFFLFTAFGFPSACL